MNRVVVPARQATEAGGIDFLESIPGLKSFKMSAAGTVTFLFFQHYNIYKLIYGDPAVCIFKLLPYPKSCNSFLSRKDILQSSL